MLEERRSEETVKRLVEKAGDGGSVMPLLGLAFWRMKHAFEREVGLSAATWFLLTTLINEYDVRHAACRGGQHKGQRRPEAPTIETVRKVSDAAAT